MFTGIIQDVGSIDSIVSKDDQAEFVFSTGLDTGAWQPGDSVAVDGCCLTITPLPETGKFAAVLSGETLNCTCFDTARAGMTVNLEPAMRLGDVLGGHMITGHIDGTAVIVSIDQAGEHQCLMFELPVSLAKYVVVKGSVAVNGVSLTVNETDDNCFTVNLIPHTLSHTNFERLVVGNHVNIETDIIGRYVERLLHTPSGAL